jgi:hypothetical protein
MLFSLDFMPPNQIDHMSLNDLRRHVATRHKTKITTHMQEPYAGGSYAASQASIKVEDS